jgi:hypothetical protein
MSDQNKKLLDDEALSAAAGGVRSEVDVAFDVIDGKYGNGDERIRRLRAAGYDPFAIQAIVNDLLRQYPNGRPSRPGQPVDIYGGVKGVPFDDPYRS